MLLTANGCSDDVEELLFEGDELREDCRGRAWPVDTAEGGRLLKAGIFDGDLGGLSLPFEKERFVRSGELRGHSCPGSIQEQRIDLTSQRTPCFVGSPILRLAVGELRELIFKVILSCAPTSFAFLRSCCDLHEGSCRRTTRFGVTQ